MKTRILMIDDDPNMITWGTILLALDGCCDIFSTQDGKSGLNILNQVGGIDLILLDINLNGLSSWDVLAAVKNNAAYAHIPVIMITDRYQARNGAQSASWSEAIDGYIEKPFVVNDFWKEIKSILNKSKSNAAHRSRQNHNSGADRGIDSLVDLKQADLLAEQSIVCPLCFGTRSGIACN